jgi:hypothetical protein
MNMHVGGDADSTNNDPNYINNQSNIIDDSYPSSTTGANNLQYTNNNNIDELRELYKNVGALPQLKDKYFLNQGVPQLEPIQRNLNQALNINEDIHKHKHKIKNQDAVDPYYNFLRDHGLLYDGYNKRRYKTTYLNINSAFRNREPCVKLDEYISLDKDPICFKKDSNIVFIKHDDHEFEEGDMITLTCVTGKNVILRTLDDNSDPVFEILPGCNVMKVFYPHCLPESYGDCILSVEIKGIRGDNNLTLGNIPINIINGRHHIKVKLTPDDIHPDCVIADPNYLDYSPNHFFILLPKKMHNVMPPYTLSEYNFKLLFLYIAGIPLNKLNAKYPIDKNHKHGYHTIKDIKDDGYSIELYDKSLVNKKGGGNSIAVCKILDIECGYPCPNQYKIDLGRTFHNIVSARLISTEIPNVNKCIKSYPSECANNKLYWNVLDKGSHMYHIELPSGSYNLLDIVKKIEHQCNKIPKMCMKVSIDKCTSKVIFKCFKKDIVCKPIIDIEPPVDPTNGITKVECDDPNYTLTIKHPNHGIIYTNTKICISGAINHLGIPEEVINTKHKIIKIVDDDTYQIELPKFNPSPDVSNTCGGVSVTILVPTLFRLRFDKHDTMGKILGFKNPCHSTSITPYKTKITNKDEYEVDYCNKHDKHYDDECKKCDYHNSIQLRNDNYILMTAEPLHTLASIGPVKRVFAKILLGNQSGTQDILMPDVMYNTFVPTSKYYEDPLNEVSELMISFLDPHGELVDFSNIDHSFTIEIVTVNDIPEGSGITANTGQNYNITV